MSLRDTLLEYARRDRLHSETLYRQDNRFRSVTDPIAAEIYRLRAEMYARLANGEDAVFLLRHYSIWARVHARLYNDDQEKRYVKSWQVGTSGYFGLDEAEKRIRHAYTIYNLLCAEYKTDA